MFPRRKYIGCIMRENETWLANSVLCVKTLGHATRVCFAVHRLLGVRSGACSVFRLFSLLTRLTLDFNFELAGLGKNRLDKLCQRVW